jgi:hypothetical protein
MLEKYAGNSGTPRFRVATPDRSFKMDLVANAQPAGSPTPSRFTDQTRALLNSSCINAMV